MHATGDMDVKTTPTVASPGGIGTITLDKHYTGGLVATSVGTMLYGGDQKAGSAGYVAFETVTGTLDGHAGTFQLMQWGTMEAGKPDLRIAVVPSSGTGALQGLNGTLTLTIVGGKHTYTLDYTLGPN